MTREEVYVYPVLPGTDWREHTDAHPFCGDDACPCREDEENLQQLNEWHNEGLIGPIDGGLIYHGCTI